ncbi:uncharacterized protein RJT20DRAFT_144803 [Scheffersomyces xylosifermentans]|uniref:uncharacterized protein n=1 Tax=Scheffersomyces xylosifermentans TaxID=1304137 RepID=UPI00315D3C80
MTFYDNSVKCRDSILNGRSSLIYSRKILFNSSTILIWLVLTFLTNRLPRPEHIFTKLLYRLDDYLFNINTQFVGPITFLVCIICGAVLLSHAFYSKPGYEQIAFHRREPTKFIPLKSVYESSPLVSISPPSHKSLSLELPSSGSSDSDSLEASLFGDSLLSLTERLDIDSALMNHKVSKYINEKGNCEPRYCWRMAPPVLLASSWLIINILYTFKTPINKPRNLAAWIFYVVLHFAVPLFIGLWLFLFHPPGALKLYSLTIGCQNIIIVMTHFLFPNASPLYIKLYGETKIPSYDMAYTDGMTRQDMKYGKYIHKAVYYATPIKFSCFPSLHASMASLVFFFVSYYSSWTVFKILVLVYVFGQWWAPTYLEHHWRIDIFMGLLYSIMIWTFIKHWKHGLNEIDARFIKARLKYDFRNGSTMGMRLFKGTRLQKLFDPLACIS